MADKIVGMEASDLFSLGANFNPQSSSTSTLKDWPNALDSVGNNECETGINERSEYSTPYVYCNASPNIVTDLGTMFTAFGGVADSKAVTGLTVGFAAGSYATVDVEGHNHAVNEHVTQKGADISTVIPAVAGFGVPAIFVDTGTNSTPISATVTASLNHQDREGADGEHWVGDNTTVQVVVTIDYIGTPTLATTGWSIDSQGATDGNQEFDGFSITAHKFFDLT